jgi:uncharacterized membrane protein
MDDETVEAEPNRTYSSARARLAGGAAAGILVGAVAAVAGTGREAPLLGWCTLALVYCAWVWAAVWPMDATATAAHAKTESPGRDLADVLLLAASLASLLAVGFVLFGAGEQNGAARYVQTALSVGAVPSPGCWSTPSSRCGTPASTTPTPSAASTSTSRNPRSTATSRISRSPSA